MLLQLSYLKPLAHFVKGNNVCRQDVAFQVIKIFQDYSDIYVVGTYYKRLLEVNTQYVFVKKCEKKTIQKKPSRPNQLPVHIV